MAFTKTQRIEITGRAIAGLIKDNGFTGDRLKRAIEEVADDMTTRGLRGDTTVACQTLVEIGETDFRDWASVNRQVRKALRAMDRPV